MKSHILPIALLFSFAISMNIHAQIDKEAKILLKNGIKIKGGIVESFDSTRLKVKIDDSNTVLIRYDLIRNIRFYGYDKIKGDFKEKLKSTPSVKTERYYHEIRASILINEKSLDFSFHTINGYQFNKYLGTGFGLGVNKYRDYVTLPLYLQVKGYMFDRKVSPFYFGDIGYGFAWSSSNMFENQSFELVNENGGLYWQLGLGYQINFYNSSMIFSLGYTSQDTKIDYLFYPRGDIDNAVEISEKRILGRVALSVGFLL